MNKEEKHDMKVSLGCGLLCVVVLAILIILFIFVLPERKPTNKDLGILTMFHDGHKFVVVSPASVTSQSGVTMMHHPDCCKVKK